MSSIFDLMPAETRHCRASPERCLLSATFMVDCGGRLLHANYPSLQFLRFDSNAWRLKLWFANLAHSSQAAISAWHQRDPVAARTVICVSDGESELCWSTRIYSFEKLLHSSGYLATVHEYLLPLAGSGAILGNSSMLYESVLLLVNEKKAQWVRHREGAGVIDTTYFGSWSEWLDRLLPDDRIGLVQQLAELTTGQRDEVSLSLRMRSPDGRIEVLRSKITAVFRDLSGKAVILKSHALVAPSTEKSSLSLRTGHCLLEHIQEPIVATDLHGKIHFWGKGAEKLYGWTADEAIGQSVLMISPEEDRGVELERMETVISKGSWSGRTILVKKDGTRFHGQTYIAIVKDDEGNPIGLVGIDNDITEWIAQQKRLSDLQASLSSAKDVAIRSELLAGCCHELCQPVFAIQNIISAIIRGQDTGQPAERLRDLFSMCTREVTRAAEISERLRSYATTLKITLVRKDAGLLVAACGSIGQLYAELAGITFRCKIENSPALILCDEVHMELVVVNLLRNAIDSLNECDSPSRTLSLRGEVRNTSYVISVTDNGIGIADHLVNRIFDPFFSTKRTGTGIGLMMCRSIVEKHGGTLDLVRSVAYEGATFEICLPLVTPADEAGGEPPEARICRQAELTV